MRNIINLSLPEDLNKVVDRMMKKGQYASKSEFLRELIRDRILEEELLERVELSRCEIREGKGKELQSLADLK